MCTGSERLAKVKELGDASNCESVRAFGDVSAKKVAGVRLNCTATVQGKGNLLIGSVYPAQLGRQRPGAGTSWGIHG
jgi:hypothetical protein